jgi:hypothetical protein
VECRDGKGGEVKREGEFACMGVLETWFIKVWHGVV